MSERITKNDLQKEVDRLNKKYFSGCSSHMIVDQAYGGYGVKLLLGDGKQGVVGVVEGFRPARDALNGLYKADSRGWIDSIASQYTKNKK